MTEKSITLGPGTLTTPLGEQYRVGSLTITQECARAAAFQAAVEAAARRSGARPAGYGLWSLQGYGELTAHQLLQVVGGPR